MFKYIICRHISQNKTYKNDRFKEKYLIVFVFTEINYSESKGF